MKLTRTLTLMIVALFLFGCCDKDSENPCGGNNNDDDAGSEKDCPCSDDGENSPDAGIDTAEKDSDPECSVDQELAEKMLVADEQLRTCIKEGVTHGEPITLEALNAFSWGLDCRDYGIETLDGVQHMTNMLEFLVSDNPIQNLSYLKDLKNLRRLHLSSCAIKDIGALRELTNLQSLLLGGNQIEDISPLEKLTALKTLHLHDNRISEIAVLNNLPNLGQLYLSGNEIVKIPDLSNLSLYYLDLADNWIGDISGLESFWGSTSPKEIDLSDNRVRDLSSLSGLKQLVSLRLDHNRVKDISPLTQLTSLEELDLAANYEIGEIPEFPANMNLKTLYLGYNRLGKWSHMERLKNLSKLETITLHDGNFRTLDFSWFPPSVSVLSCSESGIENVVNADLLKGLTRLYLGENNIVDIQWLGSLTGLKNLTLQDNLIENITALENLTVLEELSISRNCISDFSPISSLEAAGECTIYKDDQMGLKCETSGEYGG